MQRLSLKDNCLSDDAVTRMTLPHRLLGVGLGRLSVLDLSCNHSITDNSVKCLFKFHLLQALNLSGTSVTFRLGVAKLVNNTKLKVATEVRSVFSDARDLVFHTELQWEDNQQLSSTNMTMVMCCLV